MPMTATMAPYTLFILDVFGKIEIEQKGAKM